MSAQLPLDPDSEDTARTPSRPVHLHIGSIVAVFVGGTCGTAARAGVGLAIDDWSAIPVATFTVNILGAFLLGLLLPGLLRAGPDVGRRRTARLLLGTGFLGGFTTYSALAIDSAALLADGSAGRAAGYALASVVLGGLASWAGIALGTRPPASTAGPRT